LSLRLLIDENSQADALVNMLRSSGHDVVTAAEAGLSGADDATVLKCAHTEARCVVTRNARHFRELHLSGVEHSGVLVIHEDSIRAKNMTLRGVLSAVNNLDAAGIEVSGQFISLNAWNY
jgi:predicted nuclease of predicted toxin-antitoxin system